MAKGSITEMLIKDLLFNKWVLIMGGIVILYMTGAFKTIFQNPIIFVFVILGIIVVKFVGGKK